MSFMLGNAESFAHIARSRMLPQAKVLSFVMPGFQALNKVWLFGISQLVHLVHCKFSISPSVLRQPAHQNALHPGASPPLNLAVRPAAASSSVWWIESSSIVWHSQCQFAFWRFAKGIETWRTSLQSRELSLQGFSMKSVPSGKAHGPNWLVKLTPTGSACWCPPLRYGAAYRWR